MSVRLIARWFIVGALFVLCIFGTDFAFVKVAAAEEAKTPQPPNPLAVTTNTMPAEPAGNVGTNTGVAGPLSAPVSLLADRVRRIQTVQRIQPEILQSFPSLRPARLD